MSSTVANPSDGIKPERFLTVPEAADMLGIKPRTLHERTRLRTIPHRILPHSRRCLFTQDELRSFAEGCELEEVALPGGGRWVRPVAA